MEEQQEVMTLPNKPSDLIEVALSDLRKVETDPRYKIDMDVYHEVGSDHCHVCLAGSVMAKTLECDPEIDATPDGDPDLFSTEDTQKLDALDYFRLGEVADGFEVMAIDLPSGFPPQMTIPRYDLSPDKFKRQLHELADKLRAGGA